MGINEKPEIITLDDGSRAWEITYDKFVVKGYVPANDLNGKINNYSFTAPLLVVLEEEKKSMEEAIAFADSTGLRDIAAKKDASVLFVYPAKGDWDSADESLFVSLIDEVKMGPEYEDGLYADCDFFAHTLKGYYIRGTKFHTYIYSYGKSADYAAKYLLKTIQGEFLWGPGEITPAAVSMEGLSVIPCVERKDIPVLSINNSSDINSHFSECKHKLIKDTAEYKKDFYSFVKKYKMWCGVISEEPDLETLGMVEEAGSTMVKVSPDNAAFKGQEEHEVGYFAYYNKDIFDNGPAPLVLGFHGMGDSSMFLTYVSGWYGVANKHNFLFVAVENHLNIPADEVMQLLEVIKKRYKVDEQRIYAVGFSMGCGKTWDLFERYPKSFAAVAPGCALFPVYSHPFGAERHLDTLNKDIPLPLFYSGGENSHVSELPFQSPWAVERLKYAMEVNKCIKKFDFTFEDQSNWDDKFLAVKGDRVERLYDESRDAYMNVHYFDSEDGVCRTVFVAVEGQMHEYRPFTAELGWNFISQFTREIE